METWPPNANPFCCNLTKGEECDDDHHRPRRHQHNNRHPSIRKVLLSLVGLTLGYRYMFRRPKEITRRMDRAATASLANHIVQNIPWEESTRKKVTDGVDAGSTNTFGDGHATSTSVGENLVGWADALEDVVGSAGKKEQRDERVGAVGREGGVARSDGVPDWAKPSQEELETIVRQQVRTCEPAIV